MTKKEKEELFNVEDFENFLALRLAMVFTRKDCCACPVASWLRTKTNKIGVGVTSAYAIIGKSRFKLPVTLANFVETVDDEEGKITGREALRLLHQAM